MSIHRIEEPLSDLHDLVQDCIDLMKEDCTETALGIKENMRQIKAIADEILDQL